MYPMASINPKVICFATYIRALPLAITHTPVTPTKTLIYILFIAFKYHVSASTVEHGICVPGSQVTLVPK